MPHSVSADTSVMFASNVGSTPMFAKIDVVSSGNNTIVAASTGKKIRVLSYTIVSGGTVTAAWQSGASGTALSGAMPLVANTGVATDFAYGLFETAVTTLLNLSLSAGVQVSGHVTYILV